MAAIAGLSSQKLYGRALNLVIGAPNNPSQAITVDFNDKNSHGTDVSGFDIEFEVMKSLKPEPNTCDIRVFNLKESDRKQLSGAKKLTVRLEAGYIGATTLLYLAETRAAWTERDGADFITHIESGDSEKEMRSSRLNLAYGAKVPIGQAVTAIVKALGINPGNAPKVAAALNAKGFASVNGGALTGSAPRRMTDFCRSAGLEWSVQNGQIQILNNGALINSQAIELSSDTGLINSPSVDSEGIVSASCLIIPGLLPGTLVNFSSLFVKGGYRVQRCKWHGQIAGNDWQVDIEAKKY